MSRVHDLKIWPAPFEAVKRDQKRYEFRRDDRGGYEVGDILRLREWSGDQYTGEHLLAEVLYLTRGPDFGVPEGFAVMSIRRLA